MTTLSAHRTRTPPHIKWLLNERAVLQGELSRLTAQLPAVKARVAAAQLALTNAHTTLDNTQHAFDNANQRLQALTIAIGMVAPDANPDAIAPISAWAGKYGQR